MDFGSKYVYKYEHSSDESISDDEDDRMIVQPPAAPSLALTSDSKEAGAAAAAISHAKRKKRLRKADTNVLNVKFNQLLQPGEMHAGDPVYCADCHAIASHLSKVRTEENQDATWQCEFCSKSNTVDIEQTDLPKKEDATYLISPAPVVHGSDMTGVDDSIVIFVVDISGSMSSTTTVPGTFRLPNAAQLQDRAAANFDGERMVRDRHQTYVSRLQGVQMAVDANLDKLAKDTPTRRAALLTFNHEITYYGDGTRAEPLVIRGDKLNSADDLTREAEQEQNNELKPVSETKTNLTQRVYDLEEGGQTALGPAVLFALNIASKRQGSKIVICTDGLANRGLGSLETAQDEKIDQEVKMQALSEGNQFYAGLTERAREKGVSISVITIKGTACLLPVVGQMADGTSGNVTIVDLLNIRDEFASILEQKIIATNVEATLIVHRGLYIRNPDNPDDKLETVKREIGNVTKQTEVTFEFGIRSKQELKDKWNMDLDELKQLPFQVQVVYTAVDGSKALRVLTQLKETTENREVAEVNAYRGVIAQNHIRNTAAEMMVDYDDDEDEGDASRVRSKWSKPIMQKQRMNYMSNLNRMKHAHKEYEARDDFNENRWDKASSELQSHVASSRSRKMAAKPAGTTSLFSRMSRLITGQGSSTSEAAAASPPPPSPALALAAQGGKAKRSYGFATTNLVHYNDKNSEDLYRFKNLTSEYMREASPPRNEDRRSGASDSEGERKDPRRPKSEK
ncbi:unnamed protein product [Adineta ricciae]|uniref:VWFA domain-containing protein n=1 Tax=Adineta ricciae TaxID=249248 RepID=A0A815VDK1_ADIRI|nr:unnamed protein product [Adineta ricciae]CAF1529065.1 unnamed protein product [Adineta ricciae]